MIKRDIEHYMDKIETYLKANLNTKITSINTDHGDSTLDQIDSNAYIKQFADNIPNYSPFIAMYVSDTPEFTSEYGESLLSFTITIGIYFPVTDDETDYKRVWRYQRALRELIQEDYNKIAKGFKPKVIGLTPETFEIKNAQRQRATGVDLEITLN